MALNDLITKLQILADQLVGEVERAAAAEKRSSRVKGIDEWLKGLAARQEASKQAEISRAWAALEEGDRDEKAARAQAALSALIEGIELLDEMKAVNARLLGLRRQVEELAAERERTFAAIDKIADQVRSVAGLVNDKKGEALLRQIYGAKGAITRIFNARARALDDQIMALQRHGEDVQGRIDALPAKWAGVMPLMFWLDPSTRTRTVKPVRVLVGMKKKVLKGWIPPTLKDLGKGKTRRNSRLVYQAK